jgi:hypothetical protein
MCTEVLKLRKAYKKLIVSSSVLISPLVVFNSALADEVPGSSKSSPYRVDVEETNPVTEIPDSSITNLKKERVKSEYQNQLTSVSQLSDVQPTDWAFQALQSLVERYGCIAGYPNGTFRGNSAMTRYEFAAGLNACLDRVNELIATATADMANKQDLETIQKLQAEFSAELATLRGRVDALEARTSELEANQFSTTTKLTGEVIFAVSGGGSGSKPVLGADTNTLGLTVPANFPRTPEYQRGAFKPPRNGRAVSSTGDANTTFNSRVRLNLITSFTGTDRLLTRFEAGNGGGFLNTSAKDFRAAPTLQSNYGNVGLGTFANEYAGVPNELELSVLRYDFNVSKDLRVSIGPAMQVEDHVDKNSYANNEAVDFSSTFFINNPLIALINLRKGVPGAAFDWNPGQGAFSVRGLYLAANGAEPLTGPSNPNGVPPLPTRRGLFGNPYQGIVELEFAPKRGNAKGPLALRLQYTNGYYGNRTGYTLGANAEWAFSKNAGVFGRYGYGGISLIQGVAGSSINTFTNIESSLNNDVVTYNPNTFMFGFSFRDVFKPGVIAALAVGQPFIDNKVGNSTQTNFEAFINFPVTNNIRITPDLQLIFNPNNNSANDTIVVGTLRTVFNF